MGFVDKPIVIIIWIDYSGVSLQTRCIFPSMMISTASHRKVSANSDSTSSSPSLGLTSGGLTVQPWGSKLSPGWFGIVPSRLVWWRKYNLNLCREFQVEIHKGRNEMGSYLDYPWYSSHHDYFQSKFWIYQVGEIRIYRHAKWSAARPWLFWIVTSIRFCARR